MPGILATNPRQGNRLEFLAHYILSAFGSATPVLRTEDFGVDFFCNLSSTQKHGIEIENSFAVQLKSGAATSLSFGSTTKAGNWKRYELTWFLDYELPLLFGIPYREEKRLDLYSLSVSRFVSWNPKLPFEIQFTSRPPGKSEKHIHPDKTPTACGLEDLPEGCDGSIHVFEIGPPVISCNIDEVSDPEFVKAILPIFRKLVWIEQLNVIYRKLRLPYWLWVVEVETNKDMKVAYAYGNSSFTQGSDELSREMVPFLSALGFAYKAEKKDKQLSGLRALVQHLDKNLFPPSVVESLPELFSEGKADKQL